MNSTIPKSDEEGMITDDQIDHKSTDDNAQLQIEQYQEENAHIIAIYSGFSSDDEHDSLTNSQNEKSNENFIGFELASDDEFKSSCELPLFNTHFIQELNKKINSSNLINKNEIIDKNAENILENLNLFENMHFKELKILEIKPLKGLKSIKALCTKTFPKLIKLYIKVSPIENKCLDIIKALKLPKFKKISDII